ncbi:hypothetical protein BpHYR1_023323 [Brachionus plicatilis]|uniref:Uncharacterized protein n=1 Tax=Brachionus plicatilis TaxID=10195 RepID=A0A3M7Q479_BRAPC|nr:hypothetical protein BpHYR1_023323 [Brachionus plicatilis]
MIAYKYIFLCIQTDRPDWNEGPRFNDHARSLAVFKSSIFYMRKSIFGEIENIKKNIATWCNILCCVASVLPKTIFLIQNKASIRKKVQQKFLFNFYLNFTIPHFSQSYTIFDNVKFYYKNYSTKILNEI